jgi:hypothetical protein
VLEQWVPLVVGVALVLILPVGVVGEGVPRTGRGLGSGFSVWKTRMACEQGMGRRVQSTWCRSLRKRRSEAHRVAWRKGAEVEAGSVASAQPSVRGELTAAVLSMVALALHVAVVRRRNVLDVVPVRR